MYKDESGDDPRNRYHQYTLHTKAPYQYSMIRCGAAQDNRNTVYKNSNDSIEKCTIVLKIVTIILNDRTTVTTATTAALSLMINADVAMETCQGVTRRSLTAPLHVTRRKILMKERSGSSMQFIDTSTVDH